MIKDCIRRQKRIILLYSNLTEANSKSNSEKWVEKRVPAKRAGIILPHRNFNDCLSANLIPKKSVEKCRGIILSVLIVAGLCFAQGLYAQPQLPYDLIGIPTAYPLQKGCYGLDFRVYGGGGVLAKVRLGLLDALFFGLSLSIDNLVGSTSPLPPVPGVIAKFRIFDEITSKSLPTISLGFDSSLYGGMKGKGFYGIVSKEFPVGKMFLHIHGGLNRSLGDNIGMGFFIGSDFFFTPEFSAIGEFELIYGESNPTSLYGSYNFGVQYTKAIELSTLKVGFFIRNLVGVGPQSGGTREIHIGYTNKLF